MFSTTIKKIFNRNKKEPPFADLTILYGGHSGNSEFIAKESSKYFKKKGIKAQLADMAKYDFNRLQQEKLLLIVISTHGEGDPPARAKKFHRKLLSAEAPFLKNLRFSVCALGDSSYENFCQTGKEIDKRLEELGASRFLERVDCDVEFNKNATEWISAVLGKYHLGNAEKIEVNIQSNDKNKNYEGVVKDRYALDKEPEELIYHLILTIDDPEFSYLPGDSVSIIPRNPEELVNTLIKKLESFPKKQITYKNKSLSLLNFFTTQVEITTISKGLLERYSAINPLPKLKSLLYDEKKLYDYMQTSDVIDLLTDFPWLGNIEELAAIFRSIQPRSYSVSSSIKATPGELHLTVKLICLQTEKRTRYGACSSYLSHWLKPGSRINLKVVPNNEFRLPQDNRPVIMIGAGTGIAPFRAFMQELECGKQNIPSWLIFGEKFRNKNFFYEEEWKHLLDKGILNRMDVAFSRDTNQKIYVQHLLEKHTKLFCEWVESGANIYVCGAIKMGHDVRKTAISGIAKYHRLSEDKATEYIEKLEEDGRWLEDLY